MKTIDNAAAYFYSRINGIIVSYPVFTSQLCLVPSNQYQTGKCKKKTLEQIHDRKSV